MMLMTRLEVQIVPYLLFMRYRNKIKVKLHTKIYIMAHLMRLLSIKCKTLLESLEVFQLSITSYMARKRMGQ